MNDLELDPTFSQAFRTALVDEVALGKRPRRRRVWLGAVFAGILLATGAGGVATATLMSPPGMPAYEQFGEKVTATLTETGTLDLGAPPEGATSISFTVVCHTEGSWSLEGYGGANCSEVGIGSARSGTIPLTLSQQSIVLFELQPGTEVTVTAAYSKKIKTEFGVNAAGETYGSGVGDPDDTRTYAMNENPGPDLIAAHATNCKTGYIRWEEENEASGGNISSFEEVTEWMENEVHLDKYIPVYESDGTTVIGEFLIAGQPRPGQPLTALPPCPSGQ
ncbi:hypothetical protein [Herbiconiux sp.]|uniref:hypothetical protein n=1 Tax=Herbiconiux sp. TaxID=1871186 RepID=UPI0025BAEC9A|nr:hypothetical protein [Herbiconiux sp.]